MIHPLSGRRGRGRRRKAYEEATAPVTDKALSNVVDAIFEGDIQESKWRLAWCARLSGGGGISPAVGEGGGYCPEKPSAWRADCILEGL